MQQNFRKIIASIGICYLFIHEMTWNLKRGHAKLSGTDVLPTEDGVVRDK